MHIKSLVLVSLLGTLFVGCGNPGWRHYTDAKTCYFKNEANCDKHYQKAIKARGDMPGVHASYGTWLMREGKMTEAQAQFEIEKKQYPEASFAVDRAMGKTESNK